MLRFVSLFFAFVLVGSLSFSQTKPITVVRADNDTPLAGVWVYDDAQLTVEQTDEYGTFDISKFADNQEMIFFHPDFVRRVLTKKDIERENFTIALERISYTSDEVVVEGHRFGNDRAQIAQQTSEVTAKQIEFDQPRTMGETLEEAGVYVQRSQYGGGSPMIRGYTANQVLLVLDGVRMNNAIYRAGNLQNSIQADANAMGSVDVLFGPGSVQYGSDAMGGVMVFNTLDPLPSLMKGSQLGVKAFTRYATANEEETVGGTMQYGLRKWAFLGNVTYSGFGDLRSGRVLSDAYPDYGRRREYVVRENDQDVVIQNDNTSIQRFTGYTQSNLLGKVRYWHNSNFSATYALIYTTSSNIPRYDRLEQYRNGALRYAEWYYGPQELLMNRITVNAAHGGNLYDDAEFTVAHQNYQESRHDRTRDNDFRNDRVEDLSMISVNADLSRDFGPSKLFYGVEGVFNDVQSSAHKTNIVTGEEQPQSTRYPDGGSTTSSLALYGGYRFPVSSRIVATAGLRYTQNALKSKFNDKSFYDFPFDEITYNSGAPTASLGAVCSVASWQIRGALSSGFRAPNVDDVGKIFDSGDGVLIFPNPDLSSEYSYNGELGVDRAFGMFSAGATGYYSLLRDAVLIRDAQFNGQDSILYDGDMAKVKSLQNSGQAYLTGFDFHAKARLADHVTATTSLSYGAGRDTDGDLPMRPVPPLYGRTSVIYETQKWTGELFARYNTWKEVQDIPLSGGEVSIYTPDGVPSWWTLNLRSNVQVVEHLEVVASLENIFDLHYRPYASGVSAPGRNLIVSLRAAL
ncbi:MAG: TonB-dependent receptor [Calditrichaeota bacterium]|nr:TonB-dependent receptor [Calditrichota bacterium]MCB9369201.1 TonB-dependent receptor [Calditrichota bacterium]